MFDDSCALRADDLFFNSAIGEWASWQKIYANYNGIVKRFETVIRLDGLFTRDIRGDQMLYKTISSAQNKSLSLTSDERGSPFSFEFLFCSFFVFGESVIEPSEMGTSPRNEPVKRLADCIFRGFLALCSSSPKRLQLIYRLDSPVWFIGTVMYSFIL